MCAIFLDAVRSVRCSRRGTHWRRTPCASVWLLLSRTDLPRRGMRTHRRRQACGAGPAGTGAVVRARLRGAVPPPADRRDPGRHRRRRGDRALAQTRRTTPQLALAVFHALQQPAGQPARRCSSFLYRAGALWAVALVVAAAVGARRWRLARDLPLAGLLGLGGRSRAGLLLADGFSDGINAIVRSEPARADLPQRPAGAGDGGRRCRVALPHPPGALARRLPDPGAHPDRALPRRRAAQGAPL